MRTLIDPIFVVYLLLFRLGGMFCQFLPPILLDYPSSSAIAVPLPLLQAKPRSQVPRCFRNQSSAAEEEAFVQLSPFFKKAPLFPLSHHLSPSSSFLVLPQTEARQTYDHGSTEESKSGVGALLPEKDGGRSGFRLGLFYCRLWKSSLPTKKLVRFFLGPKRTNRSAGQEISEIPGHLNKGRYMDRRVG